MKIQPLNNNVFVEVEEPKDEVSKSGIIVGAKVRKTERGVVIHPAESKLVTKGDTIFFKTYAYDPVDLQEFNPNYAGKKLGFIKEEHILGKE